MHWREEAIVLSVRRHGETAAIVEVFARTNGRYFGVVHGAQSRARRPILQPGNIVDATWRARLSEQLGSLSLEAVSLKAGTLMEAPDRLDALLSLVSLTRLIAEREPHPRLYDALRYCLDALDHDDLWPALMVRWELGLLDELGFGLDLTSCVAGGPNDDLAYVSPRSSRAVSRAMGEPYRDVLLRLPAFLVSPGTAVVSTADILDGLALTGYFLNRHVLTPRSLDMPEPRRRLIARLARSA